MDIPILIALVIINYLNCLFPGFTQNNIVYRVHEGKQHGINPKTDLTIDTSIAFAAMSGAFIGGTGDFVTLFEHNVKI